TVSLKTNARPANRSIRRSCRSRLSLFPGKLVAPLRWSHLKPGAEGLVEMRQIIEAAIVGDLGNVVMTALASQYLRACIEPGFEQPASERRSQPFKAAVNCSERHGKMRRHELRRQLRAMQVLPAERQHCCGLKFGPQAAWRNIGRARQRQQVAEVFR